ncbi:MAG TPA: hypothetical protein VK095_01440 [Beutenbergiaceae bacterium]|nr:hypothetical protein [Beutenbergiaceae bacterium]
MSTEHTPTLAQMNARGQRIATAYYESGVLAGIQIGRAQVETEQAALWAEVAQHVRSLAKVPAFDVLAERRGEPERAAAQRRVLADRGIA